MGFVEMGLIVVICGVLAGIYRALRRDAARVVVVLRIENPDVMRVFLGSAGMAEMTAAMIQALSSALPGARVAPGAGTGQFRVALGDLSRRRLRRHVRALHKLIQGGVTTSRGRLVLAFSGVMVSDPARTEPEAVLYGFGWDVLQRQGPGAMGQVVKITYNPQAAGPSRPVARAGASSHVRLRFRPRISTDTGRVIGAEVEQTILHPDLGALSASEYLARFGPDALRKATGETVRQVLAALRGWQAAGAPVERMALRLSTEQLACAQLSDLILWEIDRNEMPCSSIALILSGILSGDPAMQLDEGMADHVERLASAGCGIEVDGFDLITRGAAARGAGIADRIRIGRDVVRACDRAQEQQRMILAILAMAERRGLGTLALDVGTPGEKAFLTQIGVTCLQGDAISPLLSEGEMTQFLTRRAGAEPPPLPLHLLGQA